MPIENRGSQKPSLKLKFIPYLAIRGRIFTLTNAELDDYINELFESNPFIEEVSAPSLDKDFLNNLEAPDEDIYSFLEHELNMFEIEDREINEAALFIIGNLTEDGYFKIPLNDVAKKLNITASVVEKALKYVQDLDPAGIAARNLPECFVLQLEREGSLSPKVKHIILNHLDDVINGNIKKLTKEFGLSLEYLKRLKEKLSHLNPTPGLMLNDVKEIFRTPDIIVEFNGEEYVARLNKSRDFVVNKNYMSVIKAIKDKITKEQFDSLLEKALFSERAVRERERLLLSIGDKIAEANSDYFSFKCKFPEKISLDGTSSSFKVSESAVSRIVQNKFIKTPCGTFPLRFFVKHKSMDYNDEDVKLRIKHIISQEDKLNPLTDSQIEQILQNGGIKIKRRTIAKYRGLLKIPEARKRFQ